MTADTSATLLGPRPLVHGRLRAPRENLVHVGKWRGRADADPRDVRRSRLTRYDKAR